MFCPKCGNRINEGEGFCGQCGAKLTGDEAEASQESAVGQQASDAAETEQQVVFDDTVKEKGKWAIIADFGWCILRIASTLIGMIGLLEFSSYILNREISSRIYWIFGCVIVVGNTIITFLRNKENLKISRKKVLFICGIIVAAAICIAIFFAPTEDSGGNRGDSDKYVRMVKTATLEAYPQKTVGDAFDDYLKNPKWESGLSEDGIRFVNVSGKILIYGKETDIVVQFVIKDEKAGIFSYNACELNGVPQNDLFVWGLLEVVYNENLASGVPNFGDGTSVTESDNKIEIGETWSVNNNNGNMEVTLDSIEFRGGLFGGIYFGTVPDEGCVWLVATITVKNVGTKECSFSGIETLIYDETYEYKDYGFIEGDSLSGIAPLTESKTHSIAFMVPKSVEESEKSLVLNIEDWNGETMLSYVIRPGEGISSGMGTGGDISEIIGMYEAVFEAYRNCYDGGWDMEALENYGLCYMCAYYPNFEDIGYTFMDMDGDGVEELLVGPCGSAEIFNLFTISGDDVWILINAGERDTYHYVGEMEIVNQWSSSAEESGVDYYSVIDNDLCYDGSGSFYDEINYTRLMYTPLF